MVNGIMFKLCVLQILKRTQKLTIFLDTGKNRALNIAREFPSSDKEIYSHLIYTAFSIVCYMIRVRRPILSKNTFFALFLLAQVATRILFLHQSDSPIKFMQVNRQVLLQVCEQCWFGSRDWVSSDELWVSSHARNYILLGCFLSLLPICTVLNCRQYDRVIFFKILVILDQQFILGRQKRKIRCFI